MGRSLSFVNRFATALIALLVLVALVTAAGSFDPTDQPQIDADSTPPPEQPEAVSPNGNSNERTQSDTQSSNLVDGETQAPPISGDEGSGVSSLVVVALVGGLVTAALLAVVLTGDDARAPPREGDDSADEEPDPTIPAVDPAYDSPTDNPAVRMWRRLSDHIEDVEDSATPREVAATAIDRGFPVGAVKDVTKEFETVRYGSRSPTGTHVQRADDLIERLDAAAKQGTNTNDGGDAVAEGGDDA